MVNKEEIYQSAISALQCVIDPETGADVIRMRLVQDLQIHADGTAEYVFRPSSPLCPIALPLVMQIIDKLKTVEGVTNQRVTVVDYIGADDLNKILSELPLKKS